MGKGGGRGELGGVGADEEGEEGLGMRWSPQNTSDFRRTWEGGGDRGRGGWGERQPFALSLTPPPGVSADHDCSLALAESGDADVANMLRCQHASGQSSSSFLIGHSLVPRYGIHTETLWELNEVTG